MDLGQSKGSFPYSHLHPQACALGVPIFQEAHVSRAQTQACPDPLTTGLRLALSPPT